jgi:hypothetical protein
MNKQKKKLCTNVRNYNKKKTNEEGTIMIIALGL